MPSVQEVRIHAPLIITEGAVLIFVCSVMVSLRFYARRLSKRDFGLDDIAIAAALLFVIGMAITLIAETGLKRLGYPSPVGYAGLGHANANVAGWPGELLQVPALGCIKLSFHFLYRRIFSVSRHFNRFNWLMISIIVAWTIGYFFLFLFLCGTDFEGYWTSSTTENTKCLPTKPVHLSYVLSDVITGILTVLLVVPVIWELQLSPSRKCAITGWFGLGAVTIAMSIVRTVICYQALKVQSDSDADFEYITTLTSFFSLLEAGLGLCIVCVPLQYSLLCGKAHTVLQSMSGHAAISSREFQGSPVPKRCGDRSCRARDPILGNKDDRLSLEMDFPSPVHSEAYGSCISDPEKGDFREEYANLDTKCAEISGYGV